MKLAASRKQANGDFFCMNEMGVFPVHFIIKIFYRVKNFKSYLFDCRIDKIDQP